MDRAAALRIAKLAQELRNGYLADLAAARLVAHPMAETVIRYLEATNPGPAAVPTAPVPRSDGTCLFFHVPHALRVTARSDEYASIRDRIWLTATLLEVGDALADVDYLDRGPALEFIRHLRNGLAHGNQFKLEKGQPSRPAHFTGPDGRLEADGHTVRNGPPPHFAITPLLNGSRVLFDFMGPGDVCDLLEWTSWRLSRLAKGEPAEDLWPQIDEPEPS